MSEFVTEEAFEERLRKAVSVAWHVFARKVGGGLIPINKEASMQLQYAYLLKQLLPLTLQHVGESAELELETGVKTSSPEFDTKRAKCLISLETTQKFPLQQAQLRIRHGLSDVHRRQQVGLLAVNIGDA